MTAPVQKTPPSDTATSVDFLQELAKQVRQDSVATDAVGAEGWRRRGRAIPPLHKWSPAHCGKMNLVIKANGEWWHEGTKVTRQSLVDLFATVLCKEVLCKEVLCNETQSDKGTPDNSVHYYLKTPVEKIEIEVEDAPFLVNDVNQVQDDVGLTWIEFLTTTGDVIYLEAGHEIVMRSYAGQMRPYIPVRGGMDALLTRSVLMHLVGMGELVQKEDKTVLQLTSGGKHYQIVADEL